MNMLLMSASAPAAARPCERPRYPVEWDAAKYPDPRGQARQSQALGYNPARRWHTFTPGLLHGVASAHAQHLPPQLQLLQASGPPAVPQPRVSSTGSPPACRPCLGSQLSFTPSSRRCKQARGPQAPTLPCKHLAQPGSGHQAGTSSMCRCQPEARLLQLPPTSTAVPAGTEKPPRHQLQADLQPQSDIYCHLPGAATAVPQTVCCSSSSAALTHDG